MDKQTNFELDVSLTYVSFSSYDILTNKYTNIKVVVSYSALSSCDMVTQLSNRS